jgi:hypothetical protein
MANFCEQEQQLIYRYHGLMGPAMAAGGVLLSAVVLVSGEGRPILALLAVVFFAWVGIVVYDKSEFHFDGVRRMVTGWRKNFRKTEIFRIPLADIQGVTVETSGSGAYRITIVTATGPVPLTRTYHSDYAVVKDAKRVHDWLKRNAVDVPLNDK